MSRKSIIPYINYEEIRKENSKSKGDSLGTSRSVRDQGS